MSTDENFDIQNHIDIQENTMTDNNLFKSFDNQLKSSEDDKQTINAITNLLAVLQNKRSSRASRVSKISVFQTIQQKKSQSSIEGSNSVCKNPSGKSMDFKQQFKQGEEKSITQISCSQSVNDRKSSKPKSKFAKLLSNFSVDEPHIITSSVKSFCSPSKGSLHNINTKNSHPSNLLNPGNNVTSSKKQLTSAGNLVEENEKQSPGGGIKSNRSAIGNRSGIRRGTKKKTTFALPEKNVPEHNQGNANGISLYEEVVAKNFEVIDNLLRKLNKIYANQEEYENSLIEISQKLNKIQTDNENIHHQFRTSHFMIDKKLNTITNEYSNIMHEMNTLKKRFRDGGGGGAQRISRASFYGGAQGTANVDSDNESNLNSRRRKRQSIRKNSKRCSGSRVSENQQHRTSHLSRVSQKKSSFSSEHQRNSQIKSQSIHSNQRTSNWTNLKGIDQQNLGKILLEQINESGSWQNSQNQIGQNLYNSKISHKQSSKGHQSIQYKRTDRRNQTYNTKSDSKRSKVQKQRISIDDFAKEDFNIIKSYISNEVIKVSSNSQINKQTLLGFQTIMTKKFQSFEEKIDQKFFQFQRDMIEERIEKKLRKSIVDEADQRAMKKIEKDVNGLRQQLNQKIDGLEAKIHEEMESKCSKEEVRQNLKQILESMHRKVNTLMEECYHKFAERNESKRAILFLQKKINKLIDSAHKFKNFQLLEHQAIDNTKCLSCSKSVAVAGGHHYTQSQPILTQVNCLTTHQKNQPKNDYSEIESRNDLSSHAQSRQVKFTQIGNRNPYSSVSQIFEKKNKPPQSPKGIKRLIAQFEKTGGESDSTNYETLVKKLKNRQTVDSAHFGAISSHFKTKISVTGNENRATIAMNTSVPDVKVWKSKATSILKKQADWRSKSHYKKEA